MDAHNAHCHDLQRSRGDPTWVAAILFDLDGVIVDSADATIRQFQHTLRHFNLSAPPDSEIRPLLGLRTSDIWKHLAPNIPPDSLARIREYSAELSLLFANDIRLMPHALETLNTLSQQYALGLVTNRGKRTARLLLRRLSIADLFQVIVDREDVTRHKPMPDSILRALTLLSVDANEAVYVGDSPEDVEAARNAAVRFILFSAQSLEAADYYHIHSLDELPQLIQDISHQGR